MKKLSTLTTSAIITLSALGIGTLAIAANQNPTMLSTTMSEATAITKSKISLEQAITIAQKKITGTVVSAEFDRNDYASGGKFEVKSIANNTEYEVEIDANSGKILRTKQERLDAEDIAEYSVMKQSKLSLLQAMKKATQTVNGKVTSADFDVKNSRPVYDIEVLKSTQEYDIVIDGITGRVLSNQLDRDD